jgi:hypothetical protein
MFLGELVYRYRTLPCLTFTPQPLHHNLTTADDARLTNDTRHAELRCTRSGIAPIEWDVWDCLEDRWILGNNRSDGLNLPLPKTSIAVTYRLHAERQAVTRRT